MIPLLIVAYSATAYFLWQGTHGALSRKGASKGLLAVNAVRCVLAGAIPLAVTVVAFGNWGLLAAAAVVLMVLLALPTSWMLVIDRRRPEQALWVLNRQALDIVKRSLVEPLDAASLWAVVRRMGEIDAPELGELRDLLLWRYLALWDPVSDGALETLREVRLDQLERELWPQKRAEPGITAGEASFLLGLHRATGEIVARVREGFSPNTDPTLRTMSDALAAYRRADTDGLITQIVAWVAAAGKVSPVGTDAATGTDLPDYQLPDGSVTGRSWLDRLPYFGATLTQDDLSRLAEARSAVLARAESPG